MKEYQSLSHTRWDCKYHVVFIPKKRIFGVLRKHLGEIFRELAKQKESQNETRAVAALGGSRFNDPLRGSPNKPPALLEVI